MSRLFQACIRDMTLIIDSVLNGFRQRPPYGFVPCLAIADTPLSMENVDLRGKKSLSSSNRLSELFDMDWGLLWGVPVSKTTRATKMRRRFSPHRLFAPKRNLIACQQCGTWHEIHTICGECYKKVREETEVIKKRLLAYNPFKGELPDKEAFLVYQGEQPPDANTSKDMFGSEQRIVEIDKPRPSWFSVNLKKRWQSLGPPVGKKPEDTS